MHVNTRRLVRRDVEASSSAAGERVTPIGERMVDQHAGRAISLPPGYRHHHGLPASTGDLSGLRVVESHLATHACGPVVVNEAEIHFAPGAYDPHSQSGREVLGHELAHIHQSSVPKAPDLVPGLGRASTPTASSSATTQAGPTPTKPPASISRSPTPQASPSPRG
jgi:hypothetical protein